MTIRDVQADFSYTSSASAYTIPTSGTGTFILPNSYDTSPLGGYLTEITAADTQLTGNVNTFRDLGGGEPMWLVIDFVTAVTSGGSATLDFQLITSATVALGTPTTMLDFTATAYTTYTKGYRLFGKLPRSTAWLQWIGLQVVIGTAAVTAGSVVAWLGKDVDAVQLGYASGFSIK